MGLFLWVAWNLGKFYLTVQGNKTQEERQREKLGCQAKTRWKEVPRNRGNLGRTGSSIAYPFHCRLGNWERKQNINGYEAGAVRQEEQGLWCEAHWRTVYRWKIPIILSARGQPALRLTTGGSAESLLSSNASSKVTALLWGKSYVLSFMKILALTDCLLLDSCHLFKMNDIRKLSRLVRNLKIVFISFIPSLPHLFISIL